MFARGDLFRCASGRRRIGYTMLPVNGFPEEWVRQANEMNEVWVPSIFNAQGFQRCGLTRPLQVVPLGMDLDHFHPGIEPAKLPYGFAFLSVFEWTERDAPEVLLSTFNDVVKRSEDVVLICKVTSLDPAIDVRAEIAKLGLKDAGGRIFLMLNYQLPHYQMAALYRAADCVVSPSRGNGWDLPAMEAMACGVPVVASRRDGSAEAVQNGRLGLVADPDDRDDLKRAILAALDRPVGVVPEGLGDFAYPAFTARVHDAMRRIVGDRAA